MILIRPTLKAENVNVTSDNIGRLLIVNLTLQDEDFCLVNIYAPNEQNPQVNFYHQLTDKLRPYSSVNLILGGDFNCPLENIDKTGGKDISNKKNVIHSIKEMCNNLDIVRSELIRS